MNKERLERYSLTGPENQAAVAAGLARGDWFRSAVPRKRMKELMRRSDYPAIRDTIIWLGLMGLFAGLGIDGLVMGRVIECPKHNGRFDYISGKALGAPVLEDVRTYPVKVADGTVFIELGLGWSGPTR